MSNTQVVILVIFIIYMLGMIGVGLFFCKKKMTNAEYVLGGRQLNPWVTAMSAQASDMSGWLLTGLPGLAFVSVVGGKEAVFTAIGLLLGTYLNWKLSARRLRVYTEVSGNSLTFSSYLSSRFKDKSGFIKIVSAVIICVFFTVYAASMFSAGAKLFSIVFDMSYSTSLIIGVIVIVTYVILGGFLAVSWTDMIQGILMFFALIIVPFLCIKDVSGNGSLPAMKELFSEVFQLIPNGGSNDFSWMNIIGALGWGLGYFGMPHILARFMAIKDNKQIKPATTIAMIWTTVTLSASIVIGILGTHVLTNLADNENVFISIVLKLFPSAIAGIMLAAVLAAIMSTADSQLLVASSSFSNDVYKLLKPKAKDKELMWVSRITVLVLSIIGFIIATDENSSIFNLVSYAWAGLGASFGPVMLFSLYSRKINKYGAITSMAVGALTTVVFKYGLAKLGGFWMIYELVPGFLFATISLFVVSKLTNKFISKKDIELINDEFSKMNNIINGKEIDDENEFEKEFFNDQTTVS